MLYSYGHLSDPSRPVLDRPRLRAILRSGTPGAGSALIWGPPGCGKTTLLAAHLDIAGTEGKAAFVQVTPEHADQDAFWTAIGHALAVATGRAPDAATRSAEDVLDQWGDPSAPPLIALDNCDLIPGTALALRCEALHRSPGVQLILSSRHLLTAVPRRWLLRGDVRTVGPADLAFTSAEIDELYAAAGVPESEREVDAVLERTLGWVGAVALAVRLRSRRKEGLDGALDSFAQFVDEELLARLDPHDRELLIQLSLTVDVRSGATTEPADSPGFASWLDRATDDGVLVTRPSYPGVLQPHPLITRAIDRRLALDPVYRDGVYSAATRSLLAGGDPITALRLARRAGRPALVAEVLQRNWSRLMFERFGEMNAALGELPESMREKNASLLVLHGVLSATAPADPAIALAVVEAARNLLADDDWLGQLTVGYADVLALSRASRYGDALQRADGLLAELGARSAATRLASHPVAARLAGAMGAIHLQIGDLSAARRRLDEATDFARLANSPISVLTWQSLLALVRTLEGRIDRAELHLKQVAKIAETRTWEPRVEEASADIARALVHLESYQSDEAARCLDRARAKRKPHQMLAFLAYAEALLFLQRRNAVIAVEAVEHTLEPWGDWRAPRFLRTIADCARYTALHTAGRRSEANALAEQIEPDPAHIICMSIGRACARLDEGDPVGALAALTDCLSVERHPRRQLISVLVVAALAELELGNSRAVQYFTQALAIANVSGLRRVFAYFAPGDLARLVAAVRRTQPSPEIAALCDELDVTVADALAEVDIPTLSPREREIMALLDTSLSVPELAIRLHVSPNTLKTQTRSIYRKLGVSSRAAAVAVARTRGLV